MPSSLLGVSTRLSVCSAHSLDLPLSCVIEIIAYLLLQEVRSMLRARKSGILTPVIYSVQHEAATIFMERIDGVSVRENLLSGSLTATGMHTVTSCN